MTDSDCLFTATVDSQSAGLRLDHFLGHYFPQYSRAKIIASIRDGAFLVDGKASKSSYRLKRGQQVSGSCKEQEPPVVLHPEKIDFPILFEDEHLIVLAKPPGLVVHPGSGNQNGTLVHGLLYHFAGLDMVGDRLRPGIVHRLDKDTSGIMVVARNAASHQRLVNMFKERDVAKDYVALVHGALPKAEGRLVAAIGRHPVNRQKMAVRDVGGKYAATRWKVLGENEGYSLVLVHIETGRTHQIRVHMAHLGCPVAGDEVYGKKKDTSLFGRQMLHAWRLRFVHPVSGRRLIFTAPLWSDFALVASKLFPEVCQKEGVLQ